MAPPLGRPSTDPERLIVPGVQRPGVVLDGLLALPRWLLVGLALGLLGSGVAAAVFVLAHRYLPEGNGRGPSHDGDSRRRTELRAYLDAIGEQYAEDHPVEGRPVAFSLPDRDVAITFDARAYYRIEASDTVAVLVEHEMPGVKLGDRLPFDVPGTDAGPATDGHCGDATAAAFAELGVSPSATLDEVKAAYRRRVKETHPDQGGDEDEFKRVREAYTTAKRHVG
jgi:hypothetical protein